MKRTWIFYFTTHSNPSDLVFDCDIDCIRPERTGRWKMLQENLRLNDVHSVGYMLAGEFIKHREGVKLDSEEKIILDAIKRRMI